MALHLWSLAVCAETLPTVRSCLPAESQGQGSGAGQKGTSTRLQDQLHTRNWILTHWLPGEDFIWLSPCSTVCLPSPRLIYLRFLLRLWRYNTCSASSSQLNLPPNRSSYGLTSFSFMGAALWWSLPLNIKNTKDFTSYYSLCQQYLYQWYILNFIVRISMIILWRILYCSLFLLFDSQYYFYYWTPNTIDICMILWTSLNWPSTLIVHFLFFTGCHKVASG